MLYAALRGQVSVYKRGYSPWQHAHQQTHVYSHNGDLFKKVGSDYIQNVSNLYICINIQYFIHMSFLITTHIWIHLNLHWTKK